MSLRDDFQSNCKVLENATYDEITGRLLGFLKWMKAQPEINDILRDLASDGRGADLLEEASKVKGGRRRPPNATTPMEIAAVGLAILEMCAKEKTTLFNLSHWAGIEPDFKTNAVRDYSNAVFGRYVTPFLDFVYAKLSPGPETVPGQSGQQVIPVAIQESIATFQTDHADSAKCVFIMMQFLDTVAHASIEATIKKTLAKHGHFGLLARDKQYHDDLYPNIQTYMHGCRFGIAVFERIEREAFNPNVSLEIGYMLGLKKPVLLLKERTLTALPADLMGKVYKPFDVHDIEKTIPPQIEQWMEDKLLI